MSNESDKQKNAYLWHRAAIGAWFYPERRTEYLERIRICEEKKFDSEGNEIKKS